jgi:hypothetical protein
MRKDHRDSANVSPTSECEGHKRRAGMCIANADDRQRTGASGFVVAKQDAVLEEGARRKASLPIVMVAEDSEYPEPGFHLIQRAEETSDRTAARHPRRNEVTAQQDDVRLERSDPSRCFSEAFRGVSKVPDVEVGHEHQLQRPCALRQPVQLDRQIALDRSRVGVPHHDRAQDQYDESEQAYGNKRLAHP